MISNKTRMERRKESYIKDAFIKWSIIGSIIFIVGFSISYAVIVDRMHNKLIDKILKADNLYELQKEFIKQ